MGKNNLDKCSICNNKRFNEFKEPYWKSDIIILNFMMDNTQIKETICPKCRELSFNSILKKLIDKSIVHTNKEFVKKVKVSRRKDLIIFDDC